MADRQRFDRAGRGTAVATAAGMALGCAAAGWLAWIAFAAQSGGTAEAARVFTRFLGVGYPLWVAGWALVAWAWWNRSLQLDGPQMLLLLPAAGLLMAAVWTPPLLSDDVYRYLWEGKVLAAGWNPYVFAPNAPELLPLARACPSLLAHVNNPELSAIYPPLPQCVFAGAAALGGGMEAIRLLLAVAAIAAIPLFHRWLERRGLPTGRTLAFAAHPLLCLEVGFGGHLDALMLLGVVVLLLGMEGARRRGLAAAGLAAAVLTKLAPLVLLPHAARHWKSARGRWAFAASVLGICAVAYLPFAGAGPELFSTLGTYNRNWEFNGMAHGVLVEGWYRLDPAGGRLMAPFDAAGRALGIEDAGLRLRSAKGYAPIHPAQLLARLTSGALFAFVWLAMLGRRWRFETQWLAVVGTGLLLSPVVHPWYLLALLPVAFSGGAGAMGALWWTLAIPCTYAVLPRWWSEGAWELPFWTWWVQYGGAACMMAAACWWNRRREG